MERRLAAILAADVVGYSRLMEADEVGTLNALMARRREVLDPLVARYQGRIFKVVGDGVLVEFGSAVNAVQCAIELQQGMAAANKERSDDRHIILRIGVNLGDVMVAGGDLYGDGVNIAARLESIAEPGGILISGTAYDYVKSKVKVGFNDLGPQSLKNLAEPVRAYRVSETPAPSVQTPKMATEKPSIAVLPFVNMSGDPEQQYFSDGITEDIITELSRFRSLFVIARNSSFQYREKAVDVRRVARELGVQYVVEGSVRKIGDRLRITAQLIDALTGSHLWSERFDRDVRDLFELQDEVTGTIVATLIGRVEDAEIQGSARRHTDNLAAYDRLLRGIEHLRSYGDGDNRRARELFEQAISLDPLYALAHGYLALALLVEHRFASAPDAIKARALEAGLRAVQLEPGEGRCHQFLGQAYLYRGEYDQALSQFERSMALNPTDANGLALMGTVFAATGRAEEAVAIVKRAARLNPFHPDWYWSVLAIAYYSAHRYEDALDANRRITNRTAYWNIARIAACLAQLGRLGEAQAQASEVLQLKPDFRLSNEGLFYKDRADVEHVLEGMRKAGLPE